MPINLETYQERFVKLLSRKHLHKKDAVKCISLPTISELYDIFCPFLLSINDNRVVITDLFHFSYNITVIAIMLFMIRSLLISGYESRET